MTTVSEPASTSADNAPDIHTTAGKLADLRNRLEEAKYPMGAERGREGAREGQTHRA